MILELKLRRVKIMSDAIIKVLNELCDKFGIAIDWTSDNVVPYLQDLMVRYSKYVCYTSIMWLVIGLIIMVIFAVLLYKYLKPEHRDGLIIFLLGCGMFIGAGDTVNQIMDIIEITTIPEKAIIEDIRSTMYDEF